MGKTDDAQSVEMGKENGQVGWADPRDQRNAERMNEWARLWALTLPGEQTENCYGNFMTDLTLVDSVNLARLLASVLAQARLCNDINAVLLLPKQM